MLNEKEAHLWKKWILGLDSLYSFFLAIYSKFKPKKPTVSPR